MYLFHCDYLLNRRVTLNPRQACAIESAAKWNPTRDIFVLFAPPVGFFSNETVAPIISALFKYKNIHLRMLDLYLYSKNTPVQEWIKTDKIFLSKYFSSHISDYLRYLTLNRFGGMYFDLDVVIQKNLDEMPPNFAAAESTKYVAVGAIGIDSDAVGHIIIGKVLRDLLTNYQPNEWSTSGPWAMTRVLQEICQKNHTSEMVPELCWGFKVFPKTEFYAIYHRSWEQFFDKNEKIVNETLKTTENSTAVHMWNKFSKNRKILKSHSKCAYEILAETNCPKVYASPDLYF